MYENKRNFMITDRKISYTVISKFFRSMIEKFQFSYRVNFLENAKNFIFVQSNFRINDPKKIKVITVYDLKFWYANFRIKNHTQWFFNFYFWQKFVKNFSTQWSIRRSRVFIFRLLCTWSKWSSWSGQSLISPDRIDQTLIKLWSLIMIDQNFRFLGSSAPLNFSNFFVRSDPDQGPEDSRRKKSPQKIAKKSAGEPGQLALCVYGRRNNNFNLNLVWELNFKFSKIFRTKIFPK